MAPALPLEAGEHPVPGDGLHLAAPAGDGGGDALEVGGQLGQRLARVGAAAGAGVAAQLDGEQQHVPALRLAEQDAGRRPARVGCGRAR